MNAKREALENSVLALDVYPEKITRLSFEAFWTMIERLGSYN